MYLVLFPEVIGTFSPKAALLARPSANSAPPEKPKIGKLCLSVISANTSLPPRPGPPDFAGLIALLLAGRHRQRIDPPDHAPEQPPCEMALRQHQPVVPGVLDQPAARLHQPMLQTFSYRSTPP